MFILEVLEVLIIFDPYDLRFVSLFEKEYNTNFRKYTSRDMMLLYIFVVILKSYIILNIKMVIMKILQHVYIIILIMNYLPVNSNKK